MDDDGFYMGEIDGVRGLVPSNFLTEAPDQYGAGQTSQSGQGSLGRGQRGQRGIGPGARGPPPPPRDAQMRPTRNKDACPTVLSSSQLDNVNTASTPNTTLIFNEHNQGRGRGIMNQGGNQQVPITQQQPQQQSTASSIFSSIMGVATSNPQQNQQQNQQNMQQNQQIPNQQQNYNQQQQFSQQNQARMSQMKGIPQVVPNVMGPSTTGNMGNIGNMANQQNQPGAPNLMQKLNEITAPGGDILSKGKELIFMKFGLGGK
ncbi:hypothetical protein HHI36_021430 [Cryptolaemus montrouzieri]|uniref:SH3 domain-containing protein n=1 Tax=Cryptolaemus montrouzieri TaxID=559131 RepID=A0ABD2MWY7_9CUCU